MNNNNPAFVPSAARGISRRAFIAVGLAVPFLQVTHKAFADSSSATLPPIADNDFQRLSLVVIGDNANDQPLAAAIFQAFSKTDPSFLQRAAALYQSIRQQNLSSPASFSSSSLVSDPVLKATAIALTASWYLGHTGDDHHGEVVAYEKALMWIPTKDIMVVPGYATNGPDYWSTTTNPGSH